VTTGLLLYPDHEIREVDVDLDRPDVVCQLLDTTDPVTIDLDTVSPTVLVVDSYATRDVRPTNLLATFLVFAVRREPFHGVNGIALLVGVDLDESLTDVPDYLVDYLRSLAAKVEEAEL
jgi:hypothetical protein